MEIESGSILCPECGEWNPPRAVQCVCGRPLLPNSPARVEVVLSDTPTMMSQSQPAKAVAKKGVEGLTEGLGAGCGISFLCFLMAGIFFWFFWPLTVIFGLAGIAAPFVMAAIGAAGGIAPSTLIAGECPYCQAHVFGAPPAFNCKVCTGRILVKGKDFEKLPAELLPGG